MTFRVLVGLPSFNEADTIATVTSDIDTALRTLPFRYEAQLVNADNSSDDGTTESLLATSTWHPKTTITTPHAGGKGCNWHALLLHARNEDADAVLFVDTDLAGVPSAWIHALLATVRDGADFAYPMRPPTWNGGDLTYHLAYPALAAAYGVDIREPLCGDLALSRHAVDVVLNEAWMPFERRFGVDFLLATVAATQRWMTTPLAHRRRNKFRSFAPDTAGEYRMGEKFSEVARAVQYRCARRLHQAPPTVLRGGAAPIGSQGERLAVPHHDPDIARLAESTSQRLHRDVDDGRFTVFPPDLAERLHQNVRSGRSAGGLSWDDWRDCLFAWVRDHQSPAERAIPLEVLETLFLNRVVGHHAEIAGTIDWYATVRDQAWDAFTHRHALWATP